MAAATAHAGLDVLVAGRRRDPREIIHAVLDTPVSSPPRARLGADRAAGEAVCGEPSEFGEPPAALWEPWITCPSCAVLVRAWGIELVGCSQ